MYPEDIYSLARAVVAAATEKGRMLTSVESCTGGLVSGALTAIPGSSAVLDRSFITYSNEAKTEMVDVDPELIVRHGAVSEEVARAMAAGAYARSRADLAVSVTGVAGPGGATETKPVGLVHFALHDAEGSSHVQYTFGDTLDRQSIRLEAVRVSLRLLLERLSR